MTRSAQPSVHRNVQEEFSAYSERGVALCIPESGSVFRHVGADALDLLHRLTTNSLLDLTDGAARQTVLTNEKGRVIDAPWVLRLSSDELLLVSDHHDHDPIREGVLRYTIIEDAELVDESDRLARLVVFGQNSTRVLREAFPETEFASTATGSLRHVSAESIGDAMALRTDAAGHVTWMLIGETKAAQGILSRFANMGIIPSATPVFDYVRVSNGVPIAGRELTVDVNPLEAKLHHLIDFDKGCYVGQEVIARLDTYDKVQRELIRFTLCGGDHATIRPGDRVLAPSGGRDVGWISSVATHPETDDRIGLAYVRGAHANDKAILETSAGASIELQISQNATYVVAD